MNTEVIAIMADMVGVKNGGNGDLGSLCHEKCKELRHFLAALEKKYEDASKSSLASPSDPFDEKRLETIKLDASLWQEIRSLNEVINELYHIFHTKQHAWQSPAITIQELRERLDQIEASVSEYPQIGILNRAMQIRPKELLSGTFPISDFNLFHDRVEAILHVLETTRPEDVQGRLEQARVLIEAITAIVRIVEEHKLLENAESQGGQQLTQIASKVFNHSLIESAFKGELVFEGKFNPSDISEIPHTFSTTQEGENQGVEQSHTSDTSDSSLTPTAAVSELSETKSKERTELPFIVLSEEQQFLMNQLEKLFKVFEAHSFYELISAMILKNQIGHLDFTSLQDDESQAQAQMMQTWFGIGTHRSALPGDIREICDSFGLFVQNVEHFNHSLGHFTVHFKSIHPKWIPPYTLGHFDSSVYRILCFWGSPPLSMLEAEIARFADSSEPLMIFYFSVLSSGKRKELAQICRKLKQEILIVDDLLATHLFITRASKPITLFSSILPYLS